MIYAGYVKVAPEKLQTGQVKLKVSPGTTEKAKFSLGDGKKSTGSGFAGSVTEGCVLGLYFSWFLLITFISVAINSAFIYLLTTQTFHLLIETWNPALETVVNTELKNVCDWLNANILTINTWKSGEELRNKILSSLGQDKK